VRRQGGVEVAQAAGGGSHGVGKTGGKRLASSEY